MRFGEGREKEGDFCIYTDVNTHWEGAVMNRSEQ